MKKIAFLIFFLPLFLWGNSYSTILSVFPKGESDEISILQDESEQKAASKRMKSRLLSKGISEENAQLWSLTGIVAEDQYLYFVRDAVRFPSGALGTYDRLIWKGAVTGAAGVAVLPVLSDGRLLVTLNYRHATRAWEIELPRGARDKDEANEAAAKRELQEETGGEVEKLSYLGEMTPDSGILNSSIPVYLGIVKKMGVSSEEESEVIAGNLTFTLQELLALYQKGTYPFLHEGKEKVAYVRDSFLAYALLQAFAQGYLKL